MCNEPSIMCNTRATEVKLISNLHEGQTLLAILLNNQVVFTFISYWLVIKGKISYNEGRGMNKNCKKSQLYYFFYCCSVTVIPLFLHCSLLLPPHQTPQSILPDCPCPSQSASRLQGNKIIHVLKFENFIAPTSPTRL